MGLLRGVAVASAVATAVVACCGIEACGASTHRLGSAGHRAGGTGRRPGVASPGTTAAPATRPQTSSLSTQTWLTYQADQSRTGAVPAAPQLVGKLVRKWSADLGGVVHSEAVAADGRIYVATENDQVFALNPATGHVEWKKTIGKPLTNVERIAGCGDIDPLGITGTPSVDLSTGLIYVDGEISSGGARVHRELVGLNLKTGKIEFSRNVDPPIPKGETQVQLLQRDSLAVANGRAYIGYGGNDGDCGNYHGWVVSVSLTGKADLKSFMVDPGGEGGAIWQAGGGPAIDSSGDVYVSTGNSNPFPGGSHDPGKYAESVVKLSPTLKVLASFKDPVAGGDADLSTGNPVLLPGGEVFSVGKTDNGYLLSQRGLKHLATIPGVCGSNPDGGPAFDRATDQLLIPCSGGGIQVVNLRTRKLGQRWSGANSTPILVGDRAWAMAYQGGQVYEYNPKTGARLQTLTTGQSVANFASPSRAYGLLLTPTDQGLVAFGPAS